MSNTDSNRMALISEVKDLAATKFKGAELIAFQDFLDVYLYQFPLEEWEGRQSSDLLGMCFGLWYFMKEPPNGEPKVSIFNPNLDVHGWVCGRTVITVLQKDMPFLVDSTRIELNARDIPLHVIKSTVLPVNRQGQYVDVKQSTKEGIEKEALIYIEISLQTQASELASLVRSLKAALKDVKTVVSDYQAIREKLSQARENIAQHNLEHSEELAFLAWLPESHFTFFGYRDFSFVEQGEERFLKEHIDERLGIFKKISREDVLVAESAFSQGMQQFYSGDELICFSKSSTRSNVHRAVYPDYVVVKKYNEAGEVCGEVRFLGLFTYSVYMLTPTYIPLLRKKFSLVVQHSGIDPESHDGKSLCRVMENFPRDELFQSDIQTLYDNVHTVTSINERHVVRLIMRRDPFGNFVYCMVFIPKDVYNTRIRLRVQELLSSALGSDDLDVTTDFSESILARARFVFRIEPGKVVDVDTKELEKEIVEITRNWDDHLRISLIENLGEAKGLKHYYEYKNAFSESYREHFDARTAVNDIRMIEDIAGEPGIAMHFYQPVGSAADSMRFKVMHRDTPLELSDVIPILENLGLRVLGEHPYEIVAKNGDCVWLHDFQLKFDLHTQVDVNSVRNLFESAFSAVWSKESESDQFNRLVLGARLSWREVSMLRAYAAYMKQTAFVSTQQFIADTLSAHLEITRNLVALFKACFSPRINKGATKDEERIARLSVNVLEGLDNVENLNEDKVLRRYLELIKGTLRTNFFQKQSDGDGESYKPYISLKLSPRTIPEIPEPRPMFEIFVYSPRVEGVHLRGGKVARGGLRWSDRLQDYRTEVLGLVKAQQVKNAVIVPSGAKGGFVAKKIPANVTRDEIFNEGVECYKLFIQGLLDITDNLVEGSVQPPLDVVRRDDDDPYLVVAADKGTATFSDIANAISLEYGHWLGDAFASGGSHGYDHKKMGITAKGAWVSVQRHFREKGIDIQNEEFTVLGIGDMAGDVFGNGMLLSKHIRLIAAFNHMHIFIDPEPDAEKSYLERKRLFETAGTSWQDYNANQISTGGGVFSRSAKYITISAEMKQLFGIDADRLSPNELIQMLLKAEVDLIWNGGIGTYVKSSKESNADVGDKANDSLRVNGRDLRCKVFGEGGNLGMTQLGRVEFSLNGGACNTDFIDNAAGVDCSDHEVNIKILLDELVVNGDLTEKQRNKMLLDMTDAVAELVLENNYRQTQALSVAEFQVKARINEYRRFISFLENTGRLDRTIEYLPTDEEIAERSAQGMGLTRPELSVLISYAKVMLKEELVDSTLAEDPYVGKAVETAFPEKLRKKNKKEVHQHRLKKEIVATQIANNLINYIGISSCHRLLESTGATLGDIAKAYVVSRDVFRLESFQSVVEGLDNRAPAAFQSEIMANMIRRVRRGTRWFLRNRRSGIEPQNEINTFAPALNEALTCIEQIMEEAANDGWLMRKQRYQERGLPDEWAARLSMPDNMFSGLGVVEASLISGESIEAVTKIHYILLDRLNLSWFATQISEVTVESYWQAMARESYIDDLEAQVRKLCVNILRLAGQRPIEEAVEVWHKQHQYLIDRWRAMVNEVQGTQVTDYAMFSVAMRELIDLAQATAHCTDLTHCEI